MTSRQVKAIVKPSLVHTAPTVYPPMGFMYIEDRICRCHVPILLQNIPFIESLQLGSIINLAQSLPLELDEFAEKNHIDLYNMHPTLSTEEHESCITSLEEWVKNSLEIIISLSAIANVLVIGSLDECLDCLLFGCLRRLQNISLSAITGEFKLLSGGKRVFDFEQFIEFFDPKSIELPFNIPDYLLVCYNLMSEEAEVFCVGASVEESISKIAPEESRNVNGALLHQIIFNPKDLLLSGHLKFDASVSLVNDKDDDD